MSIRRKYIVNAKLLNLLEKRIRRLDKRYYRYGHKRGTLSFDYLKYCPVCGKSFSVGETIYVFGSRLRWIHQSCYPKIFVDNEE